MTDEQTNKGDTKRDETDKPVETPKEDLTLHEKTDAATARLEAANKKTEEILNRQEKLYENQKLGGSSGGHVDAPVVSPEDKKNKQAEEFFKDTALGDAISKSNKK